MKESYPGRYRLKLGKSIRWRPHGPVMRSISRSLAPSFLERMQRVAQDFAQQHQADQKLAAKDREGYTLLLAMRSWEFEAFTKLRR